MTVYDLIAFSSDGRPIQLHLTVKNADSDMLQIDGKLYLGHSIHSLQILNSHCYLL